ncbi:hypothetical protein [Streptomyces sp. NBC_01022]|uniref:hypothetical protein n=1 Tax=Streptomyces sp. NBC_01022 TaxID=2903723 RepID=UPI002DDC3CA8|nr:hypothetical protein [Streptomyces sp. NBC_01022]WRZ79534.1 hypothetical protein OG316_04260 [Streptomyces sp. NBC_01022]
MPWYTRGADPSRHLWAGQRFEGHHLYDGKIPIIATGLRNLREHGPVFLRFGRKQMQPLREAIGNSRREAAEVRWRAELKVRDREVKEQLRLAAEQCEAEREARRPGCADCGERLSGNRWEAAQGYPAPTGRWRPALCEGCEARAVAADTQAEREREAQERAMPEQKAGWRSRFRT